MKLLAMSWVGHSHMAAVVSPMPVLTQHGGCGWVLFWGHFPSKRPPFCLWAYGLLPDIGPGARRLRVS